MAANHIRGGGGGSGGGEGSRWWVEGDGSGGSGIERKFPTYV